MLMVTAAFKRLLVSPPEGREGGGNGNKRARTGYLRELHRRMRDDTRLHDVVFVVEGQRYPAHRALVAAASPVVASMLTNGMRETGKNEVPLKELRGTTWAAVLDYIYTADIRVCDTDAAIDVLHCARRFQLLELEADMVALLGDTLKADNCCAILRVADTFEIADLGECANSILKRNFHAVHAKEEFAELAFEVLTSVVSSPDISVRSELDVLVGIVNWLVRNEDLNDEMRAVGESLPVSYCPENLDDVARMADRLLQNAGLSLETVMLRTCFESPVARELQRHVDVGNLNGQDLKVAAKISQVAKLGALYEQCVEKLMRLSEPVCTPVDPLERPKHTRYARSFTFQYRLYGISHAVSADANGEEQETPWILDPTGIQRWRLEVEFCRADDSLCLFLRAQQVGDTPKGKVTYQAFVLNANAQLAVTSTKKWTREIVEFVDSGWGWRDVLPLHKLSLPSYGIVDKLTDSIVVGATIYFVDDNT